MLWVTTSFSDQSCCMCPFKRARKYQETPNCITEIPHIFPPCPHWVKTPLPSPADQGQLLLPIRWLFSQAGPWTQESKMPWWQPSLIVQQDPCCVPWQEYTFFRDQTLQLYKAQRCRDRKYKIPHWVIVSNGKWGYFCLYPLLPRAMYCSHTHTGTLAVPLKGYSTFSETSCPWLVQYVI